MLLRSKLLIALVLGGMVAVASPATALVLLDHFDEANAAASTTVCTNGNTCSPSMTTSVVSPFSPIRSSTVFNNATLTIDGTSSALVYTAASSTADLRIRYDLGSSGQDVTVGGGDDFVIGVLGGTTIDALRITLTDMNGVVGVMQTVDPAANAGMDITLSLMGFVGGTGLDLTTIEFIDLEVIDKTGTLVLEYVQTPEPTTAGMMLLGLLGLSCAGRRNVSLV